MAELIYILPVVVGTILFPKLTSLTDIREKWLLAKKVTFDVTVGMLLMLSLAGFLANPIVAVLFGKAFLPSISAFLWLLPGVFFLGVQTVIVQFLNSIGFPITVVGVWVITALLNIGLNILVIPVYGIVGASMVSSLSYLVAFALVLWVCRKARVGHE
jgi:O-antigen/teichoic acid export membrane protein